MLTQPATHLTAGRSDFRGCCAESDTAPYVGVTAYEQLGSRMLERRPSRWASDSPLAEPEQTSALLMLEQYPAPVIALADDGAVLFANTAFAEALGCSRDAVSSMSYEEIISALPIEETLFALARLRADTIGNLLHLDGSTFFAKMSKSAIMRGADSVAIATFEELLERLHGLAEP